MILIYGGIYNNKLNFAKEKYQVTDNDVFDFENEICESQMMISEVKRHFKCLYNIQVLLKNMPEVKAIDFSDYQGIIICNDMSCGIVPLEKSDRIWRENVSRFLTDATKISQEVYRTFLGISTQLK